jgi:hypothetical protein
MTGRHCRSCGKDISSRPPKHFLCARCYGDATRRVATGDILSPALSNQISCGDVGLDNERVMQLIRLSHPDKHNNSTDATDATRWLIECRGKLKESANG